MACAPDPMADMTRTTRSLCVVVKQPSAGQTKTRLCPPLTAEMAARLYTGFLYDTLEIMRQVAGVQRTIAYFPQDARPYFHQLAPDMLLTPQRGATLGERLDNLLHETFDNGAIHAVVMDSDSPTLPPLYIAEAFTQLESNVDVVLGPCRDGGYYLIGMKQPHPRLLREIQMSTPNVLRDTIALAVTLGVSVTLLPEWYDVDTVVELEELRRELAAAGDGLAVYTARCLRELSYT